MYCHPTAMIASASRVADALQLEPAIALDLSKAGPTVVAIFIFCNLWRDVDEPEAIHAHLNLHGCRLSRETIEFLLDVYEGDDPKRHLWRRDDYEGFYIPLFDPVSCEGNVVVN